MLLVVSVRVLTGSGGGCEMWNRGLRVLAATTMRLLHDCVVELGVLVGAFSLFRSCIVVSIFWETCVCATSLAIDVPCNVVV